MEKLKRMFDEVEVAKSCLRHHREGGTTLEQASAEAGINLVATSKAMQYLVTRGMVFQVLSDGPARYALTKKGARGGR